MKKNIHRYDKGASLDTLAAKYKCKENACWKRDGFMVLFPVESRQTGDGIFEFLNSETLIYECFPKTFRELK